MGINYDVLRDRITNILTKKGIDISVADKATEELMILIEDTVWDGADRWAFKALRDKWTRDGEWKGQEQLTTSIVTHILTYWNEEMGSQPLLLFQTPQNASGEV